MNSPSPKPLGNKRRPGRNRRRNKKPEAINAVQALKQAVPAPVTGPAELPLSVDEISRLKSTFEFLREHRSTLKLRVNAAEDLLLNGKREPTHRGVCQHLLSKVDKDKVLSASQRLAPVEATKLLAGVIRFAPELVYVMRFLECVKSSAGQSEATAALTQALGSIDFEEASEAQIRQILELIVDIFPKEEQPVFLLSLLRGAPFRKAFDRSTDAFPSSLAEMLVPLRAVHQLVTSTDKRRKRSGKSQSKANPELLKEGALLLIRVSPKNLLEFNEPVRRRLFQLLCERSNTEAEIPRDALISLFRSLHFSNTGEREQALLHFASLLLRVGLEKDAKGLLRRQVDDELRRAEKQEKSAQKKQRPVSPSGRSAHFLQLLNGPRIGPIALDPPEEKPDGARKQRSSLPQSGKWYSGTHLHSLKRVRVIWDDDANKLKRKSELETWSKTLLPQVLLPVVFDTSEQCPHTFVAVERLESSFMRRLQQATESECQDYLLELCRINCALSGTGVTLPDGELSRFAVDHTGRLWLADLSGITKTSVEAPPTTQWLKEAIVQMENDCSSFSLSEEQHAKLAELSTVFEIATTLGCMPNLS